MTYKEISTSEISRLLKLIPKHEKLIIVVDTDCIIKTPTQIEDKK